jgi:segregation and condensation protein A
MLSGQKERRVAQSRTPRLLLPLVSVSRAIVIAVSSPLDLHLEHYEGPLDLLLDLIRKQQIDIKDIPIATITSQYLEYMEKAREMDIDLGAEFVYMAATLIHIKSKMLLPRDPALGEDADQTEDPRQELVERLLEHERFKNAAEMLQQKRMIEENVWSNPQIKAFSSEDDDPGLAVTLFDLVKAFGEVLDRAKLRPVYEVEQADVTVPEMIRNLRDRFLAVAPEQPIFILRVLRGAAHAARHDRAVSGRARNGPHAGGGSDAERSVRRNRAARHRNFDAVFADEQPIATIEKDYL